MSCVGVHCAAIGELQDTTELIALGSGRKVGSDVGFEDGRDLQVEGADLVVGALFLGLGGFGLPAEAEGVNDHTAIVNSLAPSLL